MTTTATQALINIERLTIRMPELEVAWTRKHDASESCGDVVKAVAGECVIEPGALKAYVNAKMRDKLAKIQREGEQLSLLLETFE
jgi:hypothetical protein